MKGPAKRIPCASCCANARVHRCMSQPVKWYPTNADIASDLSVWRSHVAQASCEMVRDKVGRRARLAAFCRVRMLHSVDSLWNASCRATKKTAYPCIVRVYARRGQGNLYESIKFRKQPSEYCMCFFSRPVKLIIFYTLCCPS